MRGFNPTAAKRIKSYANGGVVRGPGTGTSDDVQATIAKGSYIMPADSTKKLGADALGELGRPVPVNLSNGEYQMPPEQVHAVGVQALNQIKDATHAPVKSARGFAPEGWNPPAPPPALAEGAPRGFDPESRPVPVAGGARGFNPKAAKAVEPRMFFAGGGSPIEEELKRAEQKAAAAQVGSTTGATTPSAPTQPANTGGASGSWGSPAQSQPSATPPTPAASSARGFAPGMQSVLSGGIADAKEAVSKGNYGAAVGHGLRAGLAMVPAAADDALSGAAVVLNPAANALKTAVTGDSTPIGSAPPTTLPTATAAPKPAPSIAAPSPSIDRIAPAGDATAPTAAIATPPAAPAGVANAADIDRSKMTNAQVAAANPAGQVRAVRGANGVMEFSGSNVSGPVSYADAQGNAIAGQGVTGRGWGGGVTSMPARGFSPSTATSSALSGALSDAVARGDIGAVQQHYFNQGQSFGGKTEQQVRADNLMAQAQNLMNRGHVGDAQKAQMLLSTLGTMEQNANTARGFDVQRDMANTRDAGETARANARNAIDQGKLELDQKARGFDFRVAQRQEELYQRYQNAKTPEERNAIAQQIRDLKGTAAPASWKAVALQGGTDAMGNKTEGVLAAVNEQTGEVRRLDSGRGGAKEAAPTEVGQRKAGTVYSLPNGKLGRWTSQGWELVD